MPNMGMIAHQGTQARGWGRARVYPVGLQPARGVYLFREPSVEGYRPPNRMHDPSVPPGQMRRPKRAHLSAVRFEGWSV